MQYVMMYSISRILLQLIDITWSSTSWQLPRCMLITYHREYLDEPLVLVLSYDMCNIQVAAKAP